MTSSKQTYKLQHKLPFSPHLRLIKLPLGRWKSKENELELEREKIYTSVIVLIH